MEKLHCLKLVFLLISLSRCETTDDLIKACLFNILNEYFPNKPFLLVANLNVSEEPPRSLDPRSTPEFPEHIIGEIMEKQKWTIQIYNTGKILSKEIVPTLKKLGRFNDSFVFLRGKDAASDDYLYLMTEGMRRNPLWNPEGKTLVVVKAEKAHNDSAELARRVIDDLWTHAKAADNLVMVAEASGVVRFYTWFPYKQPDCSEVRHVVLLNTFERGRFRRKTHLFPEKISPDLQGCEVVVATEECIPYVSEDDDGVLADGFEFKVIRVLSEAMNFTLTPINATDRVFSALRSLESDVGFACKELNVERHLIYLALPAYAFDSLAWFVPSPTYNSQIIDIFYTFPARFWLVTICVMLATVLVVVPLVYMENGSKKPGTYVGYILKLVGVALNGPVVFPAEKSNFRLFIFSFFIYSLHITVAFQSSLLALYRQSPNLHRYTSLRDAVEDDLFVYLREDQTSMFNQSDHDVWEKILQPGRYSFHYDFGTAMATIAEEKSAIALVLRTGGIHTIFKENYTDPLGRPKIIWLEKPFRPFVVHMFMSPGNPLYSLFQRHILQLSDSGLMSFWLDRFAYVDTNWDEDDERKRNYANAPLSMAQMGGAFFLLSLLLTVAIMVFIAEICVFHVGERQKMKKNRRPLYPAVRSKGKGAGSGEDKFLE